MTTKKVEEVGGYVQNETNTADNAESTTDTATGSGNAPTEEAIARSSEAPPGEFQTTTTTSTLTTLTSGSTSTGAASQDFLMEIVAARGGGSSGDVIKKDITYPEAEEPRLEQINQLILALNDHAPEEEEPSAREEEPPPPAVGAFGVRPRRRNTRSSAGGDIDTDHDNGASGGATNTTATTNLPEVYPAGGESRNPGSFNTSLPVADGVTVVDSTTNTTTNTTGARNNSNSSSLQQRIRDAEEHGRRTVLLEAAPAQVVTPHLLQLTRKNTKMPRFQTRDLERRFCEEHDNLFLSALAVFRPLAVLSNLGFFVWDCIQPNDPPLVKCFFVKVIALMIFFPLTSLCHKYPHRFSLFGCLAMLVISTQISVSLYLIDDGFVLGAGGYGVILVPGCCGLRFNWSVVGCVATLFIANAIGIVKAIVYRHDHEAVSFEPHYVFIHLNMFIGIYCLFGLFFSYVVEWHLRQRFQANGTIFGWSSSSTNGSEEHGNHPTQQQQQQQQQQQPLLQQQQTDQSNSSRHQHHHNSTNTSSNHEE